MVGFASLVVGYLGLGVAGSIGALLIVSTISSFGNGVLRPALTSLITQEAGPHEQGVVLGLTQSMTSLASIVAPVVTGLFIEHAHLMLWATLAAALAGVGAVLTRGHQVAATA